MPVCPCSGKLSWAREAGGCCQTLATCLSERREDRTDGHSHDVAPAGHLSPVRETFFTAQLAPFGSQFPGLAPAEHATLDPARLAKALDGLEPVDPGFEAARIGLVRAVRPAELPAVIGWVPPVGARDIGSEAQDIIRLVAVLRSWGHRFGATLLQLGPSAALRVLAERPPAIQETATALAAEHWAFCDGWLGESQLGTVHEIAAALMATPIWSFWWD